MRLGEGKKYVEKDPIEIRYTYGRWGALSFDLFFSIGDNHPNPIVFAGVYP